eukprot:Mrub_07508.p1 GENE.Mrub_07508~~Mrub_07508.p1  ORF type:complete len:286 (-),score=73.74 Mrub_07508:56-844(-)
MYEDTLDMSINEYDIQQQKSRNTVDINFAHNRNTNSPIINSYKNVLNNSSFSRSMDNALNNSLINQSSQFNYQQFKSSFKKENQNINEVFKESSKNVKLPEFDPRSEYYAAENFFNENQSLILRYSGGVDVKAKLQKKYGKNSKEYKIHLINYLDSLKLSNKINDDYENNHSKNNKNKEKLENQSKNSLKVKTKKLNKDSNNLSLSDLFGNGTKNNNDIYNFENNNIWSNEKKISEKDEDLNDDNSKSYYGNFKKGKIVLIK